MLANHHLAGAISDAAWGELARIIGYQQQWRGGQVAVVDRWYPSTKTCARCQGKIAVMVLSDRVFSCPACGHQADRDLNAATNLAIWAQTHHAQIRDPEARGPVINACRADGAGPHHTVVGETVCDDAGTRPPSHTAITAQTPEKGGVS